MNKIIGVTSNIKNEKLVSVGLDNISSISGVGGTPIVLPNLLDKQAIQTVAMMIDGLLVTGGSDVDPTLFGEEPKPMLGEICPERDFFELQLIKACLLGNKPILAICRGCQILNIAAGGDLYQDIYSQIEDNRLLQHYQKAPRTHASHYINLEESSLLAKTVQSTHFKVNSFHHQAVRTVGKGFAVSAVASDGIVEGIESTEHRFVVGVQWHPENIFKTRDVFTERLFEAFVQSC